MLKALACLMVLECERHALSWKDKDSDLAEAPTDRLSSKASKAMWRDIEECRNYRDYIRRYR